eukprot:jgi/Bigna1/90142/estExt_fgenesh1_pg.C_630063
MTKVSPFIQINSENRLNNFVTSTRAASKSNPIEMDDALPELLAHARGVAFLLYDVLQRHDLPSKTIAEYLYGRSVLWEAIVPKPVPAPPFDPPTFWSERRWTSPATQPSLVFTIGAPGSGKSTWAKYFYGAHAVVAADDWFDKFNNSKFDPSYLSTAHGWCKKQILSRMKAGQTCVVNNTNTTLSEMFDYIAALEFGGYPHFVVFASFISIEIKECPRRIRKCCIRADYTGYSYDDIMGKIEVFP